jgi:glyceraldehyde 3-phosphate dehydrogenase
MGKILVIVSMVLSLAAAGVGFLNHSKLVQTQTEREAALTDAANGYLKGVLAVSSDPLVSVDINHIDASSTVALPQTQVIDGKLARVLTWYDNEWGFATRMSDTALVLAKFL